MQGQENYNGNFLCVRVFKINLQQNVMICNKRIEVPKKIALFRIGEGSKKVHLPVFPLYLLQTQGLAHRTF